MKETDPITKQNSDLMEKTTNSEFIQQFLRINITFTEDDIQNWMSCDGPWYEYMEEQGIVALISGDEKIRMRRLNTKMMLLNHQSVYSLTVKPCRKWMIT